MSLFDDVYKTIDSPSEGIFRDKGSKFIAYVRPFRDETMLKEALAEVKTLHPKARHHCWAYRLTPDRTIFRINDDGEPSGTAGRPILNVLLSLELTNLIVIVVRYFGGTLLGVPGLINAYKSATQEACAEAEIIEKTVNDTYTVAFDYLQMNDVMRITKDFDLNILNQEFDTRCKVTLEIRKSHVNQVISKLEMLSDVQIAYLRTL